MSEKCCGCDSEPPPGSRYCNQCGIRLDKRFQKEDTLESICVWLPKDIVGLIETYVPYRTHICGVTRGEWPSEVQYNEISIVQPKCEDGSTLYTLKDGSLISAKINNFTYSDVKCVQGRPLSQKYLLLYPPPGNLYEKYHMVLVDTEQKIYYLSLPTLSNGYDKIRYYRINENDDYYVEAHSRRHGENSDVFIVNFVSGQVSACAKLNIASSERLLPTPSQELISMERYTTALLFYITTKTALRQVTDNLQMPNGNIIDACGYMNHIFLKFAAGGIIRAELKKTFGPIKDGVTDYWECPSNL
jgi:hypothetical protein